MRGGKTTTGRRYGSNQELNLGRQRAEVIGDTRTHFIMDDERMKKRGARASANPDMALLDFDLTNEVGAATPPVKILRPDPAGNLVEVEVLTATEFRRRAMRSVGGRKFQARIEMLRAKRRKAGARSRAASMRLKKYGRKAERIGTVVPLKPYAEDVE